MRIFFLYLSTEHLFHVSGTLIFLSLELVGYFLLPHIFTEFNFFLLILEMFYSFGNHRFFLRYELQIFFQPVLTIGFHIFFLLFYSEKVKPDRRVGRMVQQTISPLPGLPFVNSLSNWLCLPLLHRNACMYVTMSLSTDFSPNDLKISCRHPDTSCLNASAHIS